MKSTSLFFRNLRYDIPASIVVFLVALPLCLGIALASGAPLISGLISGIVGGIVVGSLSNSSIGVSGPAAGLAIVILSAIQELGSYEIFLVSVIIAGMLQIALGFARAGILAYYFPSSVITGMLAAIGIIIFMKQIPHAVGYDADPEGQLSFIQPDGANTFSELFIAFDYLSFGPLIIATLSLMILILWDTAWIKKFKVLSKVPGPLIVVLFGVSLNHLFSYSPDLKLISEQLVSIPVGENFEDFSKLLITPDFSALSNILVYKIAFIIAIVASLETLLSVEATDKLDKLKRVTPTNRELKAQGVGNIVSGLFGGLPITQVIVRSSANIIAGGRSKLSAIFHAILIAVSVLFFPFILNSIPLASLAAILIVVGCKLAKPSIFKKIYAQGLGQFIPFLATIIGVVFTDLLFGVGIGLCVAIIGILFENFQLPFQIIDLSQKKGKHILINLAQQVTFLNKASVLNTLASIPSNSIVEINASKTIFIHPDIIEIIDNFIERAHSDLIDLHVVGLKKHSLAKVSSGMNIVTFYDENKIDQSIRKNSVTLKNEALPLTDNENKNISSTNHISHTQREKGKQKKITRPSIN